MFTGIVEGVAEVRECAPTEQGMRVVVELVEIAPELKLGDSVALNGACLTVADLNPPAVTFELAGETIRRTNLGEMTPGKVVNFERALRLGDRLDGHFVQGHVDGVGSVRTLRRDGEDLWLEVEAPAEMLAQMIFKGSITVDGISLTIAQLTGDSFSCTIIPHTWELTNLSRRSVGERVNLEVDMIGKWVARLVQQTQGGPPAAS